MYDSDIMTLERSVLSLPTQLPLRINNGGFFVSRGKGHHPDRIISSFELVFVSQGVLSIQEEAREFTVHAGESLLLWPERRHFGVHPFPPDLEAV